MEIPNRINYDVLLIVAGIFLFITPFYLNYIFIPQCNHSFGVSDYPVHISIYCPPYVSPLIIIILLIFGAGSLAVGFMEMNSNYDLDMRFKEIYHAEEISKKINYFETRKGKKLLTDECKKELEDYVVFLLKKEPSTLENIYNWIINHLKKRKSNQPKPLISVISPSKP